MFSSGKDDTPSEDSPGGKNASEVFSDSIKEQDSILGDVLAKTLSIKHLSSTDKELAYNKDFQFQTSIEQSLSIEVDDQEIPAIYQRLQPKQSAVDLHTPNSRERTMHNPRNELNRNDEPQRVTSGDSGLTSTRQDIESSAILGPKTVFKGELSGSEDIVIHGVFEGNIDLDNNKVFVGKTARVNGNIQAKNILISGLVEGEIYGQESIVIHASSQVIGKIKADRVTLEDGAKFKGSIEMDFNFGQNAVSNRSAQSKLTSDENVNTSHTRPNGVKSQERLDRLKDLEKKKRVQGEKTVAEAAAE